MKKIQNILLKILKWLLIILTFTLFFLLSFYIVATWGKEPLRDSTWEFGQEKAPFVEFEEEGKITIKDLRDFDWRKKTQSEQKNYKDFEFAVEDIEGLKMGVSHFSVNDAVAHIFIIFDLKESSGLEDFGLSIEARRDNGEGFELLSGVINDYELIYVLATEKDLLSLREKRNEEIFLYPIKSTPGNSQKLFKKLSERINSLYEKPEFYHLLWKNCAVLIADEVEEIVEDRDLSFPFIEKTFKPGFADKAIFDMGLIDTKEKDFEEVKKEYLVNFKNI